jgi:serine/threonine-protein kinase
MGSVSAASDLYALGVMTSELLAGTRPFAGPDFLGPKMRGEFAPVTSRKAGLPPRLDAFFASALSPDPTRRPKDAAAFASAFAACWS